MQAETITDLTNGFLYNADSHFFQNTLFRPCFHKFAAVDVACDLTQNVKFWKHFPKGKTLKQRQEGYGYKVG